MKPARASSLSFNRASGQRGYVLLTLMLLVSLLVIAAAAAAPTIAFQIKRDREEELVHRGVQYSRAIRLYSKKTGRFPLNIADLYDSGGTRYIRKLYKDPITGRDFRLLHTADTTTATTSVASQPDTAPGENAGNPDSNTASAVAPQDTANTASSSGSQDAATTTNSLPQKAGGLNGLANSAGVGSGSGSGTPFVKDDPTRGIIFGVASTSKGRTIREFDHKNHYNEWFFFYDLAHDRGYEIKGPTPQSLPTAPLVGQPAAGQAQPASGQFAQPAPASASQQ